MGSRKRSARKRRREAFEVQMGDGLEEAYAHAEAERFAADERREAAFRSKSCESKKRYETRQEAEETIAWCAEHGRTGLSCYRCEFCGGWHLTSHPWKD